MFEYLNFIIEILEDYLYIIIQYILDLNNYCFFIILYGIFLFHFYVFYFYCSLILIYIIIILIYTWLLNGIINDILNCLNSSLIFLFRLYLGCWSVLIILIALYFCFILHWNHLYVIIIFYNLWIICVSLFLLFNLQNIILFVDFSKFVYISILFLVQYFKWNIVW